MHILAAFLQTYVLKAFVLAVVKLNQEVILHQTPPGCATNKECEHSKQCLAGYIKAVNLLQGIVNAQIVIQAGVKELDDKCLHLQNCLQGHPFALANLEESKKKLKKNSRKSVPTFVVGKLWPKFLSQLRSNINVY